MTHIRGTALSKLKIKKLQLLRKALGMVPNSKEQLKVRDELEQVKQQIKLLEET